MTARRSRSRTLRQKVHARVTLSASTASPAPGQHVTLSGHVSPSHAGQSIRLQLFASGQGVQATKRAETRRGRWVKLPYGIPLCVGFLLYLWYVLVLAA